MPNAPSLFEVEHLHRLMIQASVEAAQLDQRLDEARKADSLWPVLRHWSEAAEALDEAVERAAPSLQREGTPKDQIDRIRERFDFLEQRSRQFDLDFDLDGCVETWTSLGHDFAQLSGSHRDRLVRLLQDRKPGIDGATAMLSEARRHEGLLQEQHRRVTALQAECDRARAKYERLRQAYLDAQRDWEAAQRQAGAESPAQQHEVKKPPIPDLRLPVKDPAAPVIVRLPLSKEPLPKPSPAVPRPASPLPPPHRPVSPVPPPVSVKPAAFEPAPLKSAPLKPAPLKPAPLKPAPLKAVPLEPAPPKPAIRKAEEKKPAPPPKGRGPAKIALERVERVVGYPTSQDGIGRGGQTAAVWFWANHLEDVVFIQGTSAIQLGCGAHLDVMPSVQIFSAVPGQPVRGKVSLLLVASGGHLGGVAPRSAQTGAMLAAAAGAVPVVARLGAIGKALQSAIREVIEDAAAKVFSRAQPKAAPHLRPRPDAAAEHHVARFGPSPGPLHRLLERDHLHRDVVSSRLETMLSQLATAPHRTLTDATAGELRGHLAQMDSVLARLAGKAGDELLAGARAVKSILQRMESLAARAGAAHIAPFRGLIEERKTQLHRIARGAPRAPALLPARAAGAPDIGHQLAELRRSNPGIDRLLRHSSQAQLAAELTRRGAVGLAAFPPGPQGVSARAGLGTASLGGGFHAPGAAHLGGFGGGQRGALGALAGSQGALGEALARQLEQQVRRGRPEETARILGGLRKAPAGTALEELASKAEQKRKQLAARAVRARPAPLASTTLLEVLREHPKGSSFASHLAPGGPLRALCDAAQRGHGLPLGRAAQHYLASRGSSQVWNAVARFNALVGEGHTPRFSLGSWLKKNVSDHVSHALQAVSQTVSRATSAATSFAGAARAGMSSFANAAFDMGRRGGSQLSFAVRSAARSAGGAVVPVGRGALQGGITALASGGPLKDALKGAAGGALDSFDPGASHALKKLKGFTAAEKLLQGKKLSKAERKLLESHKLAAPLRALEKTMANPGARRTIGALEKAASKGVKGGIWVSGKAATAQRALDKAVAVGDTVQSALSQVHDLAPSLADVLGDNAAGRLVGQIGDWAGEGDEKLEKALDYGHAASSTLSQYRGYLDKGLGFAGVKDPAKAYEKMMARRDLRAGKKGALEHVAQLKLEDHRRKHPELHLDEATRRRRAPRPQRSGVEKALVRGRRLVRQGRRVAQGVHDGLGKVHDVVEKGIAGADKVESGLELATALARQGAAIAGEDSELGQYLSHVADRAGQMHDYLGTGLGLAHEFSDKAGATHDWMEGIPGVRKEGEQERAAHLHGAARQAKKSPHWPPDAKELPPHGRGHRAAKAEPHAPARLPPAAPHEREPTRSLQHGLQAVEKFRKKAIRTGRRIDSRLTKVESALHKGIGAGKKVDSGLEKVAAVADQLSRILGDDSALGHLAHQVGEGAGAGHEKLHQALHVAQSGEKFLHKGHEIFHRGLQAAQGHHARPIEKETKDLAHEGGKLLKDGKKSVHDAGVTVMLGRRAVHDVAEAVHGGWEFVKGILGGHHGAPARESPEQAVGNALQWVTAFGKQVGAAIQQIERLVHAGRTKEAAARVQALRAMSEQTRALVTRAVQATAGDPHLAKQAASARKHYLEIRAHLSQFVRGLHGLDLDSGGEGETPPGRDRPHGGGAPGRSRKHHDPVGELIDGILDGEDGRIHVDRGAARGDVQVLDFQDVDPAAVDTWIGSGEGVKLFSEVFGAFLPAEGALVVHHRRRRGGARAGPREPHGQGPRPKRGGFFAKVFDRLEGFADRVAGWAKKGSKLLGKGMHYAELGMHGLSQVEGAAESVEGMAGKTESFLDSLGLHTLAGYAGRIGGAAGWVDEKARTLHGGLKKADRAMGETKEAAGEVEHGAHVASAIFGKVGHGHFASLVSLFKASKGGGGIEGKLAPEKVALGSMFDEPGRLDVTTLSRMQSFLGGDFAGVRIHTGPGAAEVTRRFNAEAVTVKDHIFFAPGRFSPTTVEGQKLIAHELTHVLQKGRANLDVRTAEGEALHSEHSYGRGPPMETLNLRRPEPGFRLAAEGEGMGAASGIHTAKRTRSRGHEAGGKDELPDGEEFLEQVSGRVYELLMEELEHAFESR